MTILITFIIVVDANSVDANSVSANFNFLIVRNTVSIFITIVIAGGFKIGYSVSVIITLGS